jgi:hypothetical protein
LPTGKNVFLLANCCNICGNGVMHCELCFFAQC